MPPKNIKIYKLKASDGPLSRDDLSTWTFTVKAYARQQGWAKFLPNGASKDWTASDEDDNNGFANEVIGEFHDFITTLAANCPAGFTETVIRESTSFQWVLDHIMKTFKLTTKGESFLDGLDIKFEFDDSFTYEQAWMMIKDKYISSLLPAGSRYRGKVLRNKEVLSPLAMNFLVREWLLKIDPRLPNHVKSSRGHLFTTEKPTLACNQEILCDQIEIMLQELDSKDGTSNNQISVGYVQHGRGGRGNFRFRPNNRFQNYSIRARGRGAPPSNRPSAPGRRPPSCQICLEARKYDSSMGHTAESCPFKDELRNISRQQGQPPFKVMLLPTGNNPTNLTDQFQGMTTNASYSPYQAQAGADYQYQPYDQFGDQHGYDDQSESNFFQTAPVYEHATLEEMSNQAGYPGAPL